MVWYAETYFVFVFRMNAKLPKSCLEIKLGENFGIVKACE
jgi:hypothetical protein